MTDNLADSRAPPHSPAVRARSDHLPLRVPGFPTGARLPVRRRHAGPSRCPRPRTSPPRSRTLTRASMVRHCHFSAALPPSGHLPSPTARSNNLTRRVTCHRSLDASVRAERRAVRSSRVRSPRRPAVSICTIASSPISCAEDSSKNEGLGRQKGRRKGQADPGEDRTPPRWQSRQRPHVPQGREQPGLSGTDPSSMSSPS